MEQQAAGELRSTSERPAGACRYALDMVRKQEHRVSAAAAILFFAGLLALWHFLDHSLPAPDDSSYTLGSFQYADLLKHPKFWNGHWWYDMLTVNRVYPPTVMFFNGLLRVLFGSGLWVSAFSTVLFNALLTGSVYGIACLLGMDRRAALLAAVLINLYPQTACMSHGFSLDAPLLSMVSAGLFTLLWWRASPSWKRAVICGVVLGFSCLTKQIAAAYLIGPGLLFLFEAWRADLRGQRRQASAQLVVVALLTVAIGLPWLLTNLANIKFLATDNQVFMGHLPLTQVFPQNIMFYLNSLPAIMSPLLFGSFLLSLLLAGRNKHLNFMPLTLSALIGVALVSSLTWAFPSIRYGAPSMIACAVYTGSVMSWLLTRTLAKLAVLAIIVLAVLQFVSFNFSPYPLSNPLFCTQISQWLGVDLVEIFGLTQRDRRESHILHSNPSPPEDWGQEWVLRTIDRFEGGKPVYLNILPDYIQLNGNTFELAARMLGSPVRPTTSRRWTVMGDIVRFNPEVALYYQWYLLKSGYQGNLLRDEDSDRCYAKLADFVKHSGKFRLMGSHKLPDGTTMFLYRQN